MNPENNLNNTKSLLIPLLRLEWTSSFTMDTVNRNAKSCNYQTRSFLLNEWRSHKGYGSTERDIWGERLLRIESDGGEIRVNEL